jgi:hypothetical protein
MRIIVIGGTTAFGQALPTALSWRHELIVASRRTGSIRVDICSADSARQ